MKQFLICLGLSLLAYFIGASLNGAFNPFVWKMNEGNLFLHVYLIAVWLCPMMINYLEGKPNFK